MILDKSADRSRIKAGMYCSRFYGLKHKHMAVVHKFGKVLGVAFVGLLALFLLIFFVGMFFNTQENSASIRDVGRMGDGSPQVATPPGMMDNALSFDGVSTYRQVAEKEVTGGVLTAAPAAPTGVAEKKIIKNGSLYLRVANVDQSVMQVGQIASELGGDIADSRFNQVASGLKSGSLTVKVPVNKFNEAFTRLKGVATLVLSESTTGTDVTQQYIDLQARINNKKAAEVTLQTLFERAVKISDVMEVTDKLELVRSAIESLEGQLRYLNSQTDMASITLSLTEDTTVVADQGFRPLQTLRESLQALVHMLGNLTEGLIRFLIVGLPVLLAYGLIFWLIYRVSRNVVLKLFGGLVEGKKRTVRKG